MSLLHVTRKENFFQFPFSFLFLYFSDDWTVFFYDYLKGISLPQVTNVFSSLNQKNTLAFKSSLAIKTCS